jgi:hypothetical protein
VQVPGFIVAMLGRLRTCRWRVVRSAFARPFGASGVRPFAVVGGSAPSGLLRVRSRHGRGELIDLAALSVILVWHRVAGQPPVLLVG